MRFYHRNFDTLFNKFSTTPARRKTLDRGTDIGSESARGEGRDIDEFARK